MKEKKNCKEVLFDFVKLKFLIINNYILGFWFDFVWKFKIYILNICIVI